MIEVYVFEDKDGNPDTYTTQDARKAKEYAEKWELLWCVNKYVFSDSEVVQDFTVEDTKEGE
jgi:hypothetical protein